MGKSIALRTAMIVMILSAAMTMHHGADLSAKTVKGTVVSATDGSPLIGASVKIDGQSVGTVADFDGNFIINAEDGQNLLISFIGYVEQKVKISGDSPLLVKLKENATSLEDVVVIGYGVQKKKLVTGATAQLKGDDLVKRNTTNPLQAMQGQTPGVNITNTSGQPGASLKVSIRGLGTTGNAAPLYLIDGIGGDISTLNPADIESIDVLKDAASAAIYGAQAANGVVLITTKSGKEGRTVVSYDGYVGWQNVSRKPQMLNAEQYKVIMDEYAVNMGNAVNDWASMASTWNEDGTSVDTNWFDQVTVKNAMVQSHNLSITGGNKTSTYAMSLGYIYQEGLVGGKGINDMNRYNFRINSEHKLLDGLVKVGEHMSLIYRDKRGVNDLSDGSGNAIYTGSAIRNALSSSPLNPIYGKNRFDSPYFSSEFSNWNTYDGNPLGNLLTPKSKNKDWTVDANVFAEIYPIKNLTLRTVFGISHSNGSYRYFAPKYGFDIQNNYNYNQVSQSASNGLTMVWTNTAAYNWEIGEHQFNALLGMETSRYDGEWMSAANQDLRAGYDNWYMAWLSNANSTKDKATGIGNDPTRTVSYFGRLGWNWKETYMINATLRSDGSSKFARGHRFGWFPSVSAGWTISNENWMRQAAPWLEFLKLRASWGQVGNQNIDSFQYLATMASNAYYNYGNQDAAYGSYPQRTANENLTWETSEQTNVGIDARILRGRLGLNLDYYIKTTKDWLVSSPTYATTGFETALINGGNVKNSGFEFNVTWNDRIGNDFHYNLGFNGAINHNEVTEIPTEDGIIHGKGQILSDDAVEVFRAENGHTMGYFWGYKTAGIFQNQQEIDNWIAAGNGVLQSNVKPGDVKYIDVNHDGVINESGDKVDLGNGVPTFTFGFNLGFDYKHFDFSVLCNGAAHFKILQAYRNYSSSQSNYTTAILQRWTGEGTSNTVPRMSSKASGNYEFSDLFLQDGDYLRISNITVGYDFASLLRQRWLSQARLYVQVQNLYTFTHYDGMDPEVGFGFYSWASGMDLGSYPRSRTFLVGVNVKF
ncbi:MAG: SusC/RagA family TonB-linked outer membrane protein [Muribaculaceae bacterium]